MKVTVEECETIPGEWNVRVDDRLVSWGKDERDAREVADAIRRELEAAGDNAASIVVEAERNIRDAMVESALRSRPVQMLMHCPRCGAKHVDEGEFATKPHRTHACQNPECGLVWRPALIPTVGVRFLPGYQNAPESQIRMWLTESEAAAAGVPGEVAATKPACNE